MPMADVQGWRQLQISRRAAGEQAPDELVPGPTNWSAPRCGTRNEALGSVEDIVISPQTGKIAYLVIAEGGIFGFDEKYVTQYPGRGLQDIPEREAARTWHHQGRLWGAGSRVSKDQFAITRPLRPAESESGCLLEDAPLGQRQRLNPTERAE